MKSKPIIALVMALLILIGSIPFGMPTIAADVTVTEIEYPGFSKLPVEEQIKIKELKVQGTRLKNSLDMYVAIKVLMRYGIVAYQNKGQYLTSEGFGNDAYAKETKKQEYRYLGYNLLGDKVSNDKFPNDTKNVVDPNTLVNKKWIYADEKLLSWLKSSPDDFKSLMSSPFESTDGTSTGNPNKVKPGQVLQKAVGTPYSTSLTAKQIESFKKFTFVNSFVGLATKGSIKLIQNVDGVKFYNTFVLEDSVFNFTPPINVIFYSDPTCTKVITAVDILPNQPQVTVYAKVNTNVDMFDIGFRGKESNFIKSVQNSFTSIKGPILTDLSKASQMASVFPVTLNWENYTPTYQNNEYKIAADLVPVSSIADGLTKHVDGLGTLKVRAIKPGDISPEFRIFNNGIDTTDQGVLHPSETIDTAYTFNLKDQSFIPKDSKVKYYNWFVKNHATNDYDYFAFTKDTDFTLSVADHAKYLNSKTITFKELIIDQSDKSYTVEHTVNIITKEVDTEVAKAFIYPPMTVKAGERTTIKGEGSSGSGIVDYQFDLSSNYMTIEDKPTEKKGTFFAYDTDETSKLTIRTASGKTASDSGQTHVEHPLSPVMKTNGVYKINRTIELDSTESTGTDYYPIDSVTWLIKPMEGQSVDSIKLFDGGTTLADGKRIIGDKPKAVFKQLGKYEVYMTVHSTCTYPGQESRYATKQVYGIINIQPDTPPVAKLSVPSKTIRDIDQMQMSVFEIWDESYSSDGDAIGSRKYFYRYDSDNDKATSDESWKLLYEGQDSHRTFMSPLVGYYEFRIEVEEVNDSQSSPFWNVETDTVKANTDSQALNEKMTEIINVAPITAVLADRKKVDLLFATDYEGSALASLKTEVDLLTKDLYEQGIDVKVSFINQKVKSGTSKEPIYKYTRYAKVSRTEDFTDYGIGQLNTVRTYPTDKVVMETRYQSERDYLPNYGSIPSSFVATYQDKTGNGVIDRGYKVDVSAPGDPAKKNFSLWLQGDFTGYGVSWARTISNISAWVEGFFNKEEIFSFANGDLYTIDLAKVMAHSYREQAEKKLVFITQNSTSLVTLNTAFKDWVKNENVEVNTITSGDLKDQYGYGKFVDIAMDTSNIYALTNMKRSLSMGNANTPIDMYPVEKAYAYDKQMGIKITKTNAYENGDYWDATQYDEYYTTYEELKNNSNWSMVMGNKTYVLNKGYLFKDASSYGKVLRMANVDGDIFLFELESGKTLIVSKVSNESNYTPNEVLANGNISSYAKFGTQTDFTQYDEDGRDYTTKSTGVLLLTTDGSLRVVAPVITVRPGSYGKATDCYFDTVVIRTGVSMLKGKGYGKYINGKMDYRSAYAIVVGQTLYLQSVYSVYENYQLKSTSGNNGAVAHFTSGFNNNMYSLNLPSTPQKLIVELGDNSLNPKNSYLMLDKDGKIYAQGQSIGSRFGAANPTSFITPLKEYRQITNQSPVSLHEILGLNTQSKSFNTFADFKTSFSTRYSSEAYSATIIRLLDDTLNQQTLYSDYEGDPMYASSVVIGHNQNALENSIGTDSDDGKTVSNWDGILDKTGLYTLNPKVQDSPNEDDRYSDYRLWNKDDMTLNVLVHRKPVAKMKIAMAAHGSDGAKMVLTLKDNSSYDLDHQSEAQRGITTIEWGFKAIYDSTWQISSGTLGTQLTKDMIRGDTYQVSYRVKDKEGEWSDPVVREILAGTNFLLDAKMKAKDPNQNLTKFPSGSYVTLTNVWTSYELAHHLEVQLYDGSTPIGSKQVISKSAVATSSEDFPEVNWKDIDFLIAKGSVQEKTYKVRITAVDTNTPSVTRVKEFPVTIVNNSPPKVEFSHFSPAELYEGDNHQVKITVTDPDQDLLSLKVYMSYTGEAEVLYESFSHLASGMTVAVKPLIIKDGQQIKWRAVLSDGSATDEALLQLPIKSLGIEQVDIQGAWNHWRGQTNAFGIKMSNEPYRFLSYEEINVTVVTRGNPERVLMRLSPALEAMSFKDEKGKIYRYKDEIGYEVAFPIIFRSTNVNKFNIKYILPLASSTIGWNNQRRLPPYQLEIGIEKAGRLHWTVYGDEAGEPKIDLTGNIFDLQFNQPRGTK